jgi:hypothetical protein
VPSYSVIDNLTSAIEIPRTAPSAARFIVTTKLKLYCLDFRVDRNCRSTRLPFQR